MFLWRYLLVVLCVIYCTYTQDILKLAYVKLLHDIATQFIYNPIVYNFLTRLFSKVLSYLTNILLHKNINLGAQKGLVHLLGPLKEMY